MGRGSRQRSLAELSVRMYFLECLACHHRFTSVFRNAKCERCHSRTFVYGFKEHTGKEKDPGDEPRSSPIDVSC